MYARLQPTVGFYIQSVSASYWVIGHLCQSYVHQEIFLPAGAFAGFCDKESTPDSRMSSVVKGRGAWNRLRHLFWIGLVLRWGSQGACSLTAYCLNVSDLPTEVADGPLIRSPLIVLWKLIVVSDH